MEQLPPQADPRPRALIVDDDRVVRAILRHGLESAGVEVLEAWDGVSALQQLVDHLLDLDLLVTDLRMPGLDGTTLVRVVRTEGGERELAILVVAATVTPDERDALGTLGVDAVIEKSVGSEEVVRRAAALAGAARDRRRAGEDGALAFVPIGAVPIVRRAG